MSSIVHITSSDHYRRVISSHAVVVTDFWATWCGPCRAIAPVYEQLAGQLARPGAIAFVKVDTDAQADIARAHNISAMPTFTLIKKGQEMRRVQGADPTKLNEMVKMVAAEAENAGSEGAGASGWAGKAPARGYADVTEQVDVRGLDVMNADMDAGAGARVLFETGKPSGLVGAAAGDVKGKAKAKAKDGEEGKKDWVESDTDDQLMLYVPFQSFLKIHSLQLTSLPPFSDDEDNEVMRPKTIRLYINTQNNLGFEEADDIEPTQEIVLDKKDWDQETGTAVVELRFVRFQKVSSLVVFVVDGDGDGEKVRLDRIRFVGDAGEKKAMGKLEKIGDEH